MLADGVYMGRQSVDQNGMTNSRIGFRHNGAKGRNTVANAAFADGHAEAISTQDFPCSFAKTTSYSGNLGTTTLAKQVTQNLSGYTVYPDPVAAYQIFTQSAGTRKLRDELIEGVMFAVINHDPGEVHHTPESIAGWAGCRAWHLK